MIAWMRKLRALVVLGSFAILLAGCGKENLSALIPKGYGAQKSMDLIVLTTIVMSFVLLIVVTLLVIVVVRFRKRKGEEDRIPKQVEGSTLLEFIWTSIPIILVLIMAVPTVMAEFNLADDSDSSEHLNINVTANQYWWHFEYEGEEIETSQDLYIPVGEKVYLNLIAKDVIHSFWVPSLAGKLDANPENVNTFFIEAYEEGIYYGKCTELCGPSHSLMDFKVIVVSKEDFEQWKDDMRSFDPEQLELDSVALEGKELYEQNSCMNCHAIGDNSTSIGPNLTNFGNRERFAGILPTTKEALVDWIMDPDQIKEDNKMKTGAYPNFSEQEAEKIAEYLLQLKATSITPDKYRD